MTAVENLSSGISISCKFMEGIPHWLINGSLYELNHVTLRFIELHDYQIRFTRVTLCLNDTTFQCISSQFGLIGGITRLIVIKSKFLITILFTLLHAIRFQVCYIFQVSIQYNKYQDFDICSNML